MSAEQVVRPADSLRIEATWQWLCHAVDDMGRPAPGKPLPSSVAPGNAVVPTRCSVLLVPPVPRSAHVARDFTRSALGRDASAERLDDVTVTVSELVSNALRYGRPPGRDTAPQPLLWIAVWDRLSCAVCGVTDDSDRVPVPTEPDEFAESGRGLQVISALSDTWGWSPRTGGGKVVWALFRL
ncbi:ATP-binding protein [Streptomyces sp. H51]|uniref:ATP-binding protein n=1 Tax=Streptomyces sp. H51 TaxID=3111770 RepID=UPI002D783912|nr:ATP-binding protein [Streptomyces sp. H51]